MGFLLKLAWEQEFLRVDSCFDGIGRYCKIDYKIRSVLTVFSY